MIIWTLSDYLDHCAFLSGKFWGFEATLFFDICRALEMYKQIDLGKIDLLVNFLKAELLQLKPYPFICMINCINKKIGNQKKLSPLLLYQF